MKRRSFIRNTLSAGLATAAFNKLKSSETPPLQVLDTRVISLEPHHYHGWPTMTRARSGELLLVCSGGRESHVCPFGRVELMRSHNHGMTWTLPQILLDTPIDDRDAGILETSKGTLLVTTFTSLAYEDILNQNREESEWSLEKKNRWLAAHHRIDDTERKQTLGSWMIRSEDHGITWSSPYHCLVNSPHGPIELSDGTIFYAGKELYGQNRIGTAVSHDDGKTWKQRSVMKTRGGDDPEQYHELHAVEAPSGKIIAHIRNHNSAHAGETLQAESTDAGLTWSPIRSIGVWGLPSHLLRLRDGRILMSYGYRRKPYGNQVRVSEDEGVTWSSAMPLSSDGIGHDLGYPSTVQLEDGKLVTVWYERMHGASFARLRQAVWEFTG
ncbi:MAG: glycoside hydrolase [Pirellulaceae bacterium]|nr:glycoside hydrolase [Pirellulaceae bacterium]